MFKVNNKDIRTTPGAVPVSLLLTLNIFYILFYVSIFDFEYVIAGWAIISLVIKTCFQKSSKIILTQKNIIVNSGALWQKKKGPKSFFKNTLSKVNFKDKKTSIKGKRNTQYPWKSKLKTLLQFQKINQSSSNGCYHIENILLALQLFYKDVGNFLEINLENSCFHKVEQNRKIN